MHELGLMDAMLKTVQRIAQEESLHQVHKIVLEIGELSGVVPHFIEDCYEAVVADTPYEKTLLEIEMVPGIARCNACKIDFRIDLEALICPQCGGKFLTPIAGKDLTIKQIEAD